MRYITELYKYIYHNKKRKRKMLNTVCLRNSASLESDYRRRRIYFGHVFELYNSPSNLYTYI